VQRIVVDAGQIIDDRLQLTAKQQHYLRRVLRLGAGDRFLALNGQGALWLATLTADADAQLAPIPNDKTDTSAQRPHIVLAASLPKQGFDEVVRQATELGVDEIVPLISERTLLRPSANKVKRWRKIAAEAGEQSERLFVPTISEPTAWSTWLTHESQTVRCFCVARQDAPHLLTYATVPCPPAIEIAVGPEGGWTRAELTAAIAVGYSPASLGPFVLRAVTASITALAILQAGYDFATMDEHNTI
jgi:16S rRNA (uracil1498-N3)-methyltransferase